MGWVRIDDGFFWNRKILELSKDAKLLFVAGLCHCAGQLTDGFVSNAAVSSLSSFIGVKRSAIAELVNVELWHKREDGFDVHDYLKYQPTAEEERVRRAEHAERMRRWREEKRKKKARSDKGGDTVRDSVTPPARDTPGDVSVTLSPIPIPLSTPSPSDLHPAEPGRGDETRDDDLEHLVAYWLETVKPNGSRQRAEAEARRDIEHLRRYLDDKPIEERIGYLATLAEPPKSSKYLVTTCRNWAAEHHIEIPEVTP
jgi:hypothetical protein